MKLKFKLQQYQTSATIAKEILNMNENQIFNKIKSYKFSNGQRITVKYRSKGYSIFRVIDGKPIARLRSTNNPKIFEVLWWSHRDKWESIGDFGGMFMPLHKALKYIDENAMECFW